MEPYHTPGTPHPIVELPVGCLVSSSFMLNMEDRVGLGANNASNDGDTNGISTVLAGQVLVTSSDMSRPGSWCRSVDGEQLNVISHAGHGGSSRVVAAGSDLW